VKTPSLAVAVALALVWGCGAETPEPEPDPRRDVVLILIDTLRADFVGVSGRAPYPATPEIDRFAGLGRWFGETWSSAPWTPPSVMSLMTSLEPPVHGLDLEGELLAEEVPELPAGAATLAEILRADGYRTLAVTAGGGVGSIFGFDRGFDRFYEPDGRPPSDVEAGVTRALRWLAEPDPRPTFLFFHTYEVHLPNTHPAFAAAADPASQAEAAYAGDLAVADRHLGRLFSALAADDRLRSAVVVLTSDHGENLHDRVLGGRPVEHGHHLHAELLRVPLVVVAPGLVPPAGEIETPARLLDVVPTICGLLGLEMSDVPHQGRDLSPLLLGGDVSGEVSEIFAWAPLQGPSWGAVRTAEWTYLRSPKIETLQWWGGVFQPAAALYHRPTDPGEFTDVAAAHPEVVRAMESDLSSRAAADVDLRRALGLSEVAGSSAVEALRALGYLDRDPGTRREPPAGPGPVPARPGQASPPDPE
jgi:arylsulfatase A-like enzyme